MKNMLFAVLLLSLYCAPMHAQQNLTDQPNDFLVLNDQPIDNTGFYLQENSCELTTDTSCIDELASEIDKGASELDGCEAEMNIADSNRYQQGRLDAQRLYPAKNTGAGGTLCTCLFLDPVIGLIPAILCSSQPPQIKNLGISDAALLNDTEYMRGYTDEAFSMKKKKVWTGFAWGSAAYFAVIAIYLSTND